MVTSSWRAALLALLLLVLGFIVGVGYHTLQPPPESDDGAVKSKTGAAPIAKGLVVSPDDTLLAFAGVYDQSRQSTRFVLDLKTLHHTAYLSPRGWQDYPTQWSSNGKALLVAREKIPRPVDEATGGIYKASVETTGTDATIEQDEMELLTENITPNDEKPIAGYWSQSGRFVVKTRREPKALYEVHDGQGRLVDRANVTYLQNRVVEENGATVYYVVRDIPNLAPRRNALFRIQGGTVRQLSEPLQNVSWAYVAENARWMVVCRQDEASSDWIWTLYTVTPAKARQVKRGTVPGDVIAVYWSPDLKQVLGGSGKSLWLIDIPSLQVHQLGNRADWNADDAAWLHHSPAILVASAGRFWRVEVPGGAATEMWKFPKQYWK